MSDHYWSFDVDGGMQWHDTAEEAERAADDRLTIYRDEADSDGEWPDDVESICWGRVLGHVVETTGTTEEFGEVREWVDYHLADMPGARVLADVAAEREKQRQTWGDEHDDRHTDGLLANLAADHIMRPRTDRRRQLVIAAALCIAEIERLDRAAEPKTAEPTPFEVAADIFLLVGLDLPRDLWDRLSVDEREAGVDWASAIHLEASDNDVTHPETPAWVLDLRAASEAEEAPRG